MSRSLRTTTPGNSDIKSWLARLVRNGSSAATARKVHSVLSCILNVAVDDKMLAYNPAVGVKVAKPTVTPRRYLTHLEVDRLAAAAGERNRLVISRSPTAVCAGASWRRCASATSPSRDRGFRSRRQ